MRSDVQFAEYSMTDVASKDVLSSLAGRGHPWTIEALGTAGLRQGMAAGEVRADSGHAVAGSPECQDAG